jgi:hypothetical protein
LTTKFQAGKIVSISIGSGADFFRKIVGQGQIMPVTVMIAILTLSHRRVEQSGTAERPGRSDKSRFRNKLTASPLQQSVTICDTTPFSYQGDATTNRMTKYCRRNTIFGKQFRRGLVLLIYFRIGGRGNSRTPSGIESMRLD